MTKGGLPARLRAAWRRLERGHDQLFVARWRQGARREARRQQDTLRALVMLESLGVDNPVAYETLELIPYLVADLHEWHQRMGQRGFGDPEVCC
ncbi:hypothetical protein EV191_106138 [Tamaricihabitans halophyticus]|uniref:DNA helicase n=1 Tax=Tamaricihabitans halophyticus TaxID=1262583 RepID=A0A4R2QS90_9PSEU|nr:cory-CC-star protein [Tamaricihabitans halophyticus]TCP51974.1 hypothetical protein EV191_106138 [Tamaricihabitans halophyticus]